MPRPAVTVATTHAGATVTHNLTHACCLRAEIRGEVADRVITVRESLSGQPCRCRCSSTLRTAVGLAPGEYTLVVELEQGGGRKEVHRQVLEVVPAPPR